MTHTFKFLCAMLAVSASAQLPAANIDRGNMLANPDFDQGLVNWSPSDSSSVTWVADYDAPPPGTVSLGAAAIFYSGSGPQDVHQCVGITFGSKLSNVKYTVSAWTISTCPGNARVELDWNPRSGCSDGEGIVFDALDLDTESNDWQKMTSIVVVPDGTQSVLIHLQNNGNCNDAVLFDDAYLGDRIFSDSFE